MSDSPNQYKHVDRSSFGDVRRAFLHLYEEIYSDVLADPFFSLSGFASRLDRQAQSPTWRAVIGYELAEPTGYIYGVTLQRGSTWWWAGSEQQLPDDFTAETGDRTIGIFEIMVRRPWRKKGVSTCLHEELLRGRREQRSTLLVEEKHPGVRAVYERWGYRSIAKLQPQPQSPRYDVMVLELDESRRITTDGSP